MNIFQQLYTRLNGSFKKKLVFRVGISAGFFSEYNNMIFAMHYCMAHDIMFILNSNNANFSYKYGWQDYFLPFTTESQFCLHEYYNSRMHPPVIVRLHDKIGYAFYNLWLKALKIDYTTWEIFQEVRNQDVNKVHSIEKFEMYGTLDENCKILSEYVWRYQPSVRQRIEVICDSVTLPSEYVGIHIRRGDKCHETKNIIPLRSFIQKAEEVSSCRNAFIATDDYGVIDELIELYPSWQFYTLCKPSSCGYKQSKQAKKDKLQIKDEMIDLFAEIELLAKATCFIGTFSSNIAIYMIMRMTKSRCYGVDFDEWRIW